MNNPVHIAIIMDGNGRWAKKRFLPRVAGHVKGVSTVKKIIKYCDKLGIKYLSLFAFGRDNWQRPQEEVSFLMNLLSEQIDKELSSLHANNAVIKFIGDRTRLNTDLTNKIEWIENLTANNTGILINFAVDYSGSYDITQAINRIIQDKIPHIDETILSKYLLTSHCPNPDLLIRTSGETRISDFMLWQIAYSEIHFTDTLWPDFDEAELDKSISWFNLRERRFGKISEQIKG